jgi:acyl dehydratase
MPRIYWEDFTPGAVTECGPRLITREEIIAFATEFDPQPMHLDEAAGRASMLGGLAASGWHVCCIMMKMNTEGLLADTSFMGAPGVEEVRWLVPLYPGTSVTMRAKVIEKRASRSRPDMGLVNFENELVDGAGRPLMTLKVTPMFGRRAPGAPAPAQQGRP